MTYEIDNQNNRIKITGPVIELKQWMLTLDEIISTGDATLQIADDILHLDMIYEPKQLDLSSHERLHYSKDELLYVQNVSEIKKNYWFEAVLIPHFEKARKIIGQ